MADWAEKIAIDILGVCSCHEGYVIRNMIDPACVWHDCGEELIAALRATAVEYERKGLERAKVVVNMQAYYPPVPDDFDEALAGAFHVGACDTQDAIMSAIQSLLDQEPMTERQKDSP